jgi:hypothetical protein
MTLQTFLYASSLATLACITACATNPPPPAGAPQPLVPGSRSGMGVTELQVVVDDDVVTRLAEAACDRSQSCNRIGPGAHYPNREACVSTVSAHYRADLNAAACPGGIGEAGLAQCERSLHDGECTEPGQLEGSPSHCKLASICVRHPPSR